MAKKPSAIVARARTGTGRHRIHRSARRSAWRRPPLYDLTELQRHANRLFGFSAQKTLDIAQALYERHKLISYPRTDSRHLSQDVADTLPRIVRGHRRRRIANTSRPAPASARSAAASSTTPKSPTTTPSFPPPHSPAQCQALRPTSARSTTSICRRLLTAWHEDHIWSVTTVITAIANPGIIDRYHTSGTAVQQVGWKVLDLAPQAQEVRRARRTPDFRRGLAQGQPQDVLDVEALRKKTRAPKRFTEATLLTAMETAGKTLDEKELSDAMKETGLGTPATRAAIIEVLLKRAYIVRDGKSLEATDKGIRLIEVVHPEVKSPAMTGQWEAYLQRIQRGAAAARAVPRQASKSTCAKWSAKSAQVPAVAPRCLRPQQAPPAQASATAALRRTPVSHSAPLAGLLHSGLRLRLASAPTRKPSARPLIEGKDVLLVMPTGSGKSLCYQLPGIARGGTTLVISPLIALMEDQVGKAPQSAASPSNASTPAATAPLRARPASITSTASCNSSSSRRSACASPAFPRCSPSASPRSSPSTKRTASRNGATISAPTTACWASTCPRCARRRVIALTATATPARAGRYRRATRHSTQAARFIHGFRRDNIAIEVVEVPPSQRAALAVDLLARRRSAGPPSSTRPRANRPPRWPPNSPRISRRAAYHAGLDAEHRKRVQEQFLAGKIEVMVATIAFGMGIDKPDVRTVIHTALPGSLEAYYQEIGRAGRDGKPSRAILMHSYADRHTHDFFFERDYPTSAVLDRIYAALTRRAAAQRSAARPRRAWMPTSSTRRSKSSGSTAAPSSISPKTSAAAMTNWRESYHRAGRAEARSDRADDPLRRKQPVPHVLAGAPLRRFRGRTNACGICDFCAPTECIGQRFRPATDSERLAAAQVVAKLKAGDAKSTGKLHAEIFPHGEISRNEFEDLLGALSRAGVLRLADASFEKDGKSIPYRKAALTRNGHSDGAAIDFLMKDNASAEPVKLKSKKKATRKSKPKLELTIDPRLEAKLRDWRLAQAKRLGVPAFRIFSDQAMRAIAVMRPSNAGELLAISGIGAGTVDKYGKDLYRLVHESR